LKLCLSYEYLSRCVNPKKNQTFIYMQMKNISEPFILSFCRRFPLILTCKIQSEFYQDLSYYMLRLWWIVLAALNWLLSPARNISNIFLSHNYIRTTALFSHCRLAGARVWKRMESLYRPSPGTALPSRGQDSCSVWN